MGGIDVVVSELSCCERERCSFFAVATCRAK